MSFGVNGPDSISKILEHGKRLLQDVAKTSEKWTYDEDSEVL